MGYKTTNSLHAESIYFDDGTYIRIEESVYIEEPFIQDFAKSTDEHLVFGWANVALDKEGNPPLDWQGDVTKVETLEKAAYAFVLKHRVTGENHKGEAVGHLVESMMFTKEKIAKLGLPEGSVPEGWWVGFYIPDDEVCAKIKTGEYKMFSIQGKAKRIAL